MSLVFRVSVKELPRDKWSLRIKFEYCGINYCLNTGSNLIKLAYRPGENILEVAVPEDSAMHRSVYIWLFNNIDIPLEEYLDKVLGSS